jgi:transglutaminase-like putative cysteine protease
MPEVPDLGLPGPESADLGRYLEDTITIDWQTPSVMEQARATLAGCETPEERVAALFRFVRDEIRNSLDHADPIATCSASQVLSERTGLDFAKSHLLAGLLRFAGYPTGFCYLRRVDETRSGRFVLHGFNAVYWTSSDRWIFLDASGPGSGDPNEARFEPPWRLSYAPDVSRGETFLPTIFRRPAKRIIDLLERAPDFESIRRHLPDAL